ncbi:MAG: cytochrome P450 [Actinomycetota bacterium]|nr:cytochrome P450 [Actinomycetota bacterium]MDQ2955379.1 cytochrome P450 [Actinomycetota bacterium]
MTETQVDPNSTAVLDYPASRGSCPFDPPEVYTVARSRPELARVRLWDGSSPWLITRYADVRAVLGDRRFSADNTATGFPFTSAATAATGLQSRSFIRMDDPQHQRLRRMLTGDFRLKRMLELQPQIQQIVDGLVDRMIATGPPAELVSNFAFPMPSLVICLLLGVPYEDHDFFQERSRLLLNRNSAPEIVLQANRELSDYLSALAGRKIAAPDSGLLSELVHEHELPGEISRDETTQMARLLLIAGHETTANMTGLGILSLLRHPDQLAALRADPELIPGAVEELLRYLSVVHSGVARLATEDIHVGDTLIRAGEGVLCMINVANRDDEQFGPNTELDVHRDARRHVAFGYGVHQCLGQPLARIELQVALETVLRRLPNLALAGPMDEIAFRDQMVVYGVQQLPVTW